jgi:hypothetical protein
VRITVAVAVAMMSAALATAAVASADPPVPQVGTPCAPDLADVMTWPADAKVPLACLGGQWQAVMSPPPPNDRWLSVGPVMTLHGQGLRNPSVTSGEWTAVPQDSTSSCRAEQRAVIDAGVVGPPQVAQGQQSRPLSFSVVPQLYSIEMSGYCLWTRTEG